MVISGLVIQNEPVKQQEILENLEKLSAISVEEEAPGKLVAVLEAKDLESAYAYIKEKIEGMKGVLGAYPAYVHTE